MSVGSSKSESEMPKVNKRREDARAPDKAAKHQPDGSKVTTPPTDPANSDETLRRNKNGNS